MNIWQKLVLGFVIVWLLAWGISHQPVESAATLGLIALGLLIASPRSGRS